MGNCDGEGDGGGLGGLLGGYGSDSEDDAEEEEDAVEMRAPDRPKVALPGPGDLSSNISAEEVAAAAAEKATRAERGEARALSHLRIC